MARRSCQTLGPATPSPGTPMRKLLSIVGGLFLLALVILGSFVGYAAHQGKALDASSKAYVEVNIPAIVATWSRDDLTKRSSPQLIKVLDEHPEQLDQLFQKFSKLGTLKSFSDIRGESNVVYTTRNGKVTTATYEGHAKFENGEGQITIRLMQESGEWRILFFHIDSPLFLQ